MSSRGLIVLIGLSLLMSACSSTRPEGPVCRGICPRAEGPVALLPTSERTAETATPRSAAAAMAGEGLKAEIRNLLRLKAESVPRVAPERALADLPRVEDGRIHVLALSAGGAFGAFGAGFLNGWSEQTTNELRRPEEFDVVTGVSAGALLSTFAFLGPVRDGDLERQFTTISTEDVFRQRSLLRALFSDAFYDTAPLRRTLQRLVTPALLNEVADATAVDAEDGMPRRFLFVLAVNLDSGLPRILDLGAIARDREAPDRIDRYVDALMASAAIPVAFPPVFIDGDMHVDGGARLALFFNRFMEEQRASADGSTVPAPKLDIVVNAEATVLPTCTENRLLGIGQRSIDVVLNQITLDSLYRAIGEAEQAGGEVRYVTADGSGCEEPDDVGDPFDPVFLRCLFAFGQELGSSNQPFNTGLDAFPTQEPAVETGEGPLACPPTS